jgi:hypothetical protein
MARSRAKGALSSSQVRTCVTALAGGGAGRLHNGRALHRLNSGGICDLRLFGLALTLMAAILGDC